MKGVMGEGQQRNERGARFDEEREREKDQYRRLKGGTV